MVQWYQRGARQFPGSSSRRTRESHLHRHRHRHRGGTQRPHRIRGRLLSVDVRVPKEMGGAGGATNPEQLFAAGYAACFHSALKLVGKDADLTDSAVSASVSIGMLDAGGFGLAVELDVAAPSSTTTPPSRCGEGPRGLPLQQRHAATRAAHRHRRSRRASGNRATGPGPSRSVAVVVGLERAGGVDAEVLGLLVGELGELHAEGVEVQRGRPSRRAAWAARTRRAGSSPVLANSSIWAITWLLNEQLITKLGWPVAQPRLTRRPSASTRMAWPSGKVHRSVPGLSWSRVGAAAGQAGHVDLAVEVADVADDGVVLHLVHVVDGDDPVVAGGRHEDVGRRRRRPRASVTW